MDTWFDWCKDLIAVIRASGSARSSFSVSGSGIVAKQLIEKIRTVKESKKFKAVLLRIDSPGGDALASDLMWREIKLLAEKKPVIASMSDVAASGEYYMAMAAGAIVAENLTLTGKFNLEKLYEKLVSTKNLYQEESSLSLLPLNKGHSDQMKQNCLPSQHNMHTNSFEIRQLFQDQWLWRRWKSLRKEEFGSVWTGGDAASRGLVDAIGGFSRAVEIAKEKANIPQDKQVTLVEMSRPSPTLPELLSGMGSSLVGVDRKLKELLQGLAWSE